MRSYPLCENRKMYSRLWVRVRSTDPVLDWIVKSEAAMITYAKITSGKVNFAGFEILYELYQADGFTFV